MPLLRLAFGKRPLKVVAALLLALLVSHPARAQNLEQQTKAARVASLVRSTVWPKGKAVGANPLVIGVFGEESMADTLREVVGSRKMNGREVIVKRCTVPQEIAGCHVVFICRIEQDRTRELLRKAAGEPILTIGDGESFLDRGGIVQLAAGAGTVQFTFDSSNLRRASLQIDPETLLLANPPGRR
jgi:hypothetical protein